MSERLRESLSALMDDEADDLELGRILRAMDSGEGDLGATWSRYQLVSAALKGSSGPVGLRPLPLDFAAADAEPMDDGLADGGPAREEGASPAGNAAAWQRGGARRALGSFAVAASITAVAVIGWQWQAGVEGEAAQMAAASSTPAPTAAPAESMLPALRAANQSGLLQASEPGANIIRESARTARAPARPAADLTEAEMRQQVEAYMVRHAEHNALHSRSGVMPFARMAAFNGAQ